MIKPAGAADRQCGCWPRSVSGWPDQSSPNPASRRSRPSIDRHQRRPSRGVRRRLAVMSATCHIVFPYPGNYCILHEWFGTISVTYSIAPPVRGRIC